MRRPVTVNRVSDAVAAEPLHSSGIWGMQTLLQPYFVAHNDIHVGVRRKQRRRGESRQEGEPDVSTHRSTCRPRPMRPTTSSRALRVAPPTSRSAAPGRTRPERHPRRLVADRSGHPYVHQLTAGEGHHRWSTRVRRLLSRPSGRRQLRWFTGQGGPRRRGAREVELQGEREMLVTIVVHGSLDIADPTARPTGSTRLRRCRTSTTNPTTRCRRLPAA